jgi:ABC-type polar amino acid transport system ATPase subunit
VTEQQLAEVASPELIDTTLEPVIDAAADERVVVCDSLGKWYGSFCALHDVTVSVERGEVITIVGRSGSGKSSFIRCLNRLEPYQQGHLRVLGMSNQHDAIETKFLRERVGMVFQDFNLFPMLTVRQNVTAALRLVHGWSKERAIAQADTMLERVEMLGHADKRPAQLSGGEQQRVAIARTLATDPELILLDEPTASIDPELTRGVMQLLAEIAATEVTVVAVTHEMQFARSSSDRVLFFDGGTIVESGPPDEIFEDPTAEATRRFIEDARLLLH